MKETMKVLLGVLLGVVIVPIIAIISMIALIFLINFSGFIFGKVRGSYLINWQVVLPKPEKEEQIFFDGYRDNVSSDALYYNNNKYIDKMKGLTKIDSSNIEYVRDKFNKYLKWVKIYGDEWIELLNEKDVSSLINENNYYFYKQDKKLEDRFLIMLTDTENHILYLFDCDN